MKPPPRPARIYVEEVGQSISKWDENIQRLESEGVHQDQNTVIVTPTRGTSVGSDFIPLRWHRAVTALVKPVNGRVYHQICAGAEVGHAYNSLIQWVLTQPVIGTFPWLVTCEDDTLPPKDALLSLLADIGDLDALAAVYFTKGDGGIPLMYGDPEKDRKLNFRPRLGPSNAILPVYGAGMGFTLFRMDVFRRLDFPWFETLTKMDDDGVVQCTQDLFFFQKMHEAGMRVAASTKVLCAHLDTATDTAY